MTRILIAEDEERITSFLERGLRANGFSTQAVRTGPEAVALARDGDFDLLILDLGLPLLDGQEVLRQVVELVRAQGATELLTSYVPGEGGPAGFYARHGFVPRGDLDPDGEVILRLDLRE